MNHTLHSTLVIAGLVLLLAGPSALAGQVEPPAKVGEFAYISVSSPHPYAPGHWLAPTVLTMEVGWPGATYIKVHFSRFDLAPGDKLEVISADGAERYEFFGKGYKNKGADFWVNSVLGEKAILVLTSYGQGGYGFDIDYFTYGIVPLVAEQDAGGVESVCGTQDWRDVKCYESSYPTEYDRAKRSVFLLQNGSALCSGVKVGCPNQFLTNQHCLSSQLDVDQAEVRFEYQLSGCGTGTSSYSASYLGDVFQKADFTLDYCLFTTLGESSAYAAAELDVRTPDAGERIYISGHPAGGVKKLSIESDRDGGFCKEGGICTGNAANSDICYYCDTTNGSSGSPVWSSQHKVIALHHFGGCPNSGVRMDLIHPQISNLLSACAPSSCGNGLCDAGEDKCNCPGDCGNPPNSEVVNSTCTDSIDNDCDGPRDCADSDCRSDRACCKPSGASCTVNADCCSNRCSGKKNAKTCR